MQKFMEQNNDEPTVTDKTLRRQIDDVAEPGGLARSTGALYRRSQGIPDESAYPYSLGESRNVADKLKRDSRGGAVHERLHKLP